MHSRAFEFQRRRSDFEATSKSHTMQWPICQFDSNNNKHNQKPSMFDDMVMCCDIFVSLLTVSTVYCALPAKTMYSYRAITVRRHIHTNAHTECSNWTRFCPVPNRRWLFMLMRVCCSNAVREKTSCVDCVVIWSYRLLWVWLRLCCCLKVQ